MGRGADRAFDDWRVDRTALQVMREVAGWARCLGGAGADGILRFALSVTSVAAYAPPDFSDEAGDDTIRVLGVALVSCYLLGLSW